MHKQRSGRGFTLVEVLVGVAVFTIFALGIYGSLQMVLKAIYQSRVTIIQTALLDERLEIARNLSFDSVGIINGLPAGSLPHTTTTVRNGMSFLITTAVRNVDDPFDGTLGGTPNDLASADYKLVEITVKCTSCEHASESKVSTIIPPKDLEGDNDNGAIFIYVTDSHHNPVVGADVHVVNTSTAPSIIIDDVTDKDGRLHIVDTPTGTQAYNITISKADYSTDYTVPSSTENPNPTNRPITVAAQQISETYFSIDLLSSLTVHALDESCAPMANSTFAMTGSKLIGNPNVKKYNQTWQVDASGNRDIGSLEFDRYAFAPLGGYDLAGSLPLTPFDLAAGAHADVTLLYAPHTANSLLASIIDNETDLPLSDATVVLKKSGYNSVLRTNYGNIAQTDWSGGSGEQNFSASTSNKYMTDLFVDTISAPGNVTLAQSAGQYVQSGELDSSIFDIGKLVDMKNVLFTTEAMPAEAGEDAVQLQLAMSNSSTIAALSNFVGPDGTASSFYSSTNTIVYTGGQQYRYFRYRLWLHTNDQNYTPAFSGFALTFTNGCTPPGQVFYHNLAAGTYEMDVSAAGYDTATSSILVNGTATATVKLYKSL